MLVASPAHADNPRPIRNNPNVVVGYDNDNEVFRPVARSPQSTAAVCKRGTHTFYVTRYSNNHKAVGPAQSNHNGTSSKATMTFTATVSGTVGFTHNATLTLQAGRVIAEGEVATGVNLSASLTASLGNSVTVTARPRSTVSAKYGVWRKKIIGRYTICMVRSQVITGWTPWKVGWYISES
ncbi:hypothetical protein Aph01nite_67570 [Acrocarpospora phusangensis]|uniref:Uncharacterized protein n=2 Tax=Acrocarpospora phusangensis TaxID=1070424 RepID=A0A919QGC1_9ACTN|nr:hypothetical protein Aph01nite_67570 [Acrocarpospora phusangensis]